MPSSCLCPDSQLEPTAIAAVSQRFVGSIDLLCPGKAAVKVLLVNAKLLILVQIGSSIEHLVCFVLHGPDQPCTALQTNIQAQNCDFICLGQGRVHRHQPVPKCIHVNEQTANTQPLTHIPDMCFPVSTFSVASENKPC